MYFNDYNSAKAAAGGDTDSTQVDRQINWQKKIDDLKAQLDGKSFFAIKKFSKFILEFFAKIF